MQGKEIVEIAVKALDNKKAVDIKAIEVTEVTVLADYFVLATATSSTHVRALADEVEDALSQNVQQVGFYWITAPPLSM